MCVYVCIYIYIYIYIYTWSTGEGSRTRARADALEIRRLASGSCESPDRRLAKESPMVGAGTGGRPPINTYYTNT